MPKHPLPFLGMLIPYAGGILTGLGSGSDLPIAALLILPLSLLLYIPAHRRHPGRSIILLALSLFVFGTLTFHMACHFRRGDNIVHMLPPDTPARFRARIEDFPAALKTQSLNRMRVSLAGLVQADAVLPCTGSLYVYITAPTESLHPGDLVEFSGRLHLPSEPRNPGSADLVHLFRLKGIDGSVFLRDGRIEVREKRLRSSLLFRLRLLLSDRIRRVYGPRTAPIVNSLLLGIRNEISTDEWNYFRDSGTIHILAISGLHMGLLIGMAHLILTAFRLNLRLKTTILLLLLIAYTGLAGARVPVVRTAVMLGIHYLAVLCGRRSSIHNTLSGAAFLILLIDPLQLLSLGFILSFTAILALFHLTPLLRGLVISPRTEVERLTAPPRSRLQEMPLKAIFFSTAAWLGTFPIIIGSFNIITPYSVPANLMVVPLVAVILGSGFLFLLLTPLGLAAAALPGGLGIAAVHLLLWAVKAIHSLPGSLIACGYFPWALYYAGLMVLIIAHKRAGPSRLKRGLAAAAFLLLLVSAALLTGLRPGPARLHILDVGHGDCSLIEDGRTIIMIDTGSRSRAGSLRGFLRSQGFTRIDLLIISHFDEDHCGNLDLILKEFRLGALLVPPDSSQHPLLARARAAKVPILESSTVNTLQPGRMSITIAAPPLPAVFSSNDRSLVCFITAGQQRLLFTGDIEDRGISNLLEAPGLPPAGILKAPHHGRADAAPALIRAFRPALVVLSQNHTDRRYAEDLHIFLDAQGIPWYSTLDRGYACIELGRRMKIRPFLP